MLQSAITHYMALVAKISTLKMTKQNVILKTTTEWTGI